MPNSYIDFTRSFSETDTVSFTNTQLKYLETAHIRIQAVSPTATTTYLQTDNGQDGATPPFAVTASSGTTTVNMNNMPSGWSSNVTKVRALRVTPSDNLLTTFANSSLLRAEDLNNNSEQLLFVLQEQLDQGVGSLPLNAEGNYDAGSRKIVSMGDGTSDQDAATFGQLSAFATFGDGSIPGGAQQWAFDLGTGGDGTVVGGNTTFTLSPTPLSNIDVHFIVEVAGVIQQPSVQFAVNDNILTVNADLTAAEFTGDKLIVQGFGVARNTLEFPITVNAQNDTDTSLTFKGAAGGDSNAVETKNATNTKTAEITHGGVVRAGTVEPLAGGGLTVSPTSISMGGTTIVPVAAIFGGTISAAGAFSGTTATLSGADPSPSDDVPTRVVTKNYVDAYGGAAATGLGTTNLDTLVTPGLYTGQAPASGLGFPAGLTDGDIVSVRVMSLGGGVHFAQELTVGPNNRKFFRTRGAGNVWSAWEEGATLANKLHEFALATADVNLNSNKLINVTDPTAAQDAATKAYVDSVAWTIGSVCGSFTLRNSNTLALATEGLGGDEVAPLNFPHPSFTLGVVAGTVGYGGTNPGVGTVGSQSQSNTLAPNALIESPFGSSADMDPDFVAAVTDAGSPEAARTQMLAATDKLLAHPSNGKKWAVMPGGVAAATYSRDSFSSLVGQYRVVGVFPFVRVK